jgi:beta-lactamase regulating signal transducer with metallopeptidase domain
MRNLFDANQWLPPARELVRLLLDAGVKSAVVLAAAGVALVCMRRRPAAARYMVCFLAVASLPLLPGLSWMLPGWRVLPAWMDLRESKPAVAEQQGKTVSVAKTSVAIPAGGRQAVRIAEAPAGRGSFDGNDANDGNDGRYVVPIAADPAGRRSSGIAQAKILSQAVQIAVPQEPPAERAGLNVWRAGLLAWLAGVVLALTPVVLGVLSLHRLERAARRETAAAWLDLLDQLLTRLGFQRRVVLLKAAQRRMPMTWGVLRPKVLLPEESGGWPEERRGAVLLHELAHAKRRDYLTHLIARLVCALYWFNPLVWLAARRMVAERERACDDIVLRHGAEPADYAEQVLEISAGLSTGWLAGCGGVAMARPSSLESRLLAILDAKRDRAALTRRAVAGALLLLTVILVPVAMMKAAPGPQPANPQSAIRNLPSQSDLSRQSEATADTQSSHGSTESRPAVEDNPESAIRNQQLVIPQLALQQLALQQLASPQLANPQSDWGEAANGLRTRVVAEQREFRAGEPIRMRIEVTNVSDQAITFQMPVAPYMNGYMGGVIVRDANSNVAPAIGGGGQFLVFGTNIAAGAALQLHWFDLTDCYYLRHPGSYSAQFRAGRPPMQSSGSSIQALPLSGKFEFEVVSDAAADDDGDPVGRLLPILPEKWWLRSFGNQAGPLRPGGNREEVTGRALLLGDGVGDRMTSEGRAIWLWLTGQRALEQEARAGDTTPSSEYLGRAGRFFVYIHTNDNALKDWPTAEEDILTALQATVVNFDTRPAWSKPVNGFQVRLRAPADAESADAPPRLLVDIANLGPMKYKSMTNYYPWQVEVDGRWYTSDGKRGPVDSHGGFAISGGAWLDVVPGQPWTNLPLVLDAAWRVAGSEEIGIDRSRFGDGGPAYLDNPPLKLSPGKHTVRLAVAAETMFAGDGPVRAVSNPVEIEVQTNARQRGANAIPVQSVNNGGGEPFANPQSVP